MQDLVSVIIPIYKVEKDLGNCIESVLHQNYSNLDVILVDDGSPDRCGYIADEYANTDSRIAVIHKKNGGLSDARNAGLKVVKGNYLFFLDSDDVLELCFVERMMSLIKETGSDVAICRHSFFDENSKIWGELSVEPNHIVLSGVAGAERILYQKGYDVSAWGKMYKRSLFDDLQFPVNYNFEDIPTTYKALVKAEKIVFTNETLYKYQIRSNSIENEAFTPKKLDGIHTGTLLFDEVRENYPQLINAARSRFIAINFHILAQINQDIPEKYEVQKNIKNQRMKVMMDRHAKSKVRIACLLSYFGFDITVHILNRRKKHD